MRQQVVPQLRFPEFTDEWQAKKLKEYVTFDKGGLLSKADIKSNGLFQCIHYGELFTEYKEVITSVKSKTDVDTGKESKIGDILMPSSDVTPQGLARASSIQIAGVKLGGDINILRPNKRINSVLLSYLLNYQKKNIMRIVSGTTVRHIYAKDIGKIPFTIPLSIEEQAKLADFMMRVDDKVTLTKEKIKRWKQYKKSIEQKIFIRDIRFTDDYGKPYPDWEKKNIGDIFTIKAGSSKSKHVVAGGEYIIVDMGAISADGKLIEAKMTNLGKDFLNRRDLVMAKDDIGGGNIIGKVVLIPQDNRYVCGDHVYRLIAQTGNTDFMYYLINSSKVNRDFRQKANGTAQIGITNRTVAEQLVNFPVAEEQNKIADFLLAIDDKIKSEETNLTSVLAFKKYMMQRMFV